MGTGDISTMMSSVKMQAQMPVTTTDIMRHQPTVMHIQLSSLA